MMHGLPFFHLTNILKSFLRSRHLAGFCRYKEGDTIDALE